MGFGYSDIPSNGITDSFSLALDGTGDYAGSIKTADFSGWKPTNLHLGATMAYLLKFDSVAGMDVMGCHFDKRWYLGVNSGKIKVGVLEEVYEGAVANLIKVGEWVHLAISVSGSGVVKAYFNGKLTTLDNLKSIPFFLSG